ncbi:LYR motif-containing protein 1-like [Arapaima gigas]
MRHDPLLRLHLRRQVNYRAPPGSSEPRRLAHLPLSHKDDCTMVAAPATSSGLRETHFNVHVAEPLGLIASRLPPHGNGPSSSAPHGTERRPRQQHSRRPTAFLWPPALGLLLDCRRRYPFECISIAAAESQLPARYVIRIVPGRFMMTAATRHEVLALYRRVLRIARSWRALSGLQQDTDSERRYIAQEARTLFRQNQQVTDLESIRRCIEECQARVEIGLHYQNPYPRPVHIPAMGLATQKGRRLRMQERLRKQAKPIYLRSLDDS